MIKRAISLLLTVVAVGLAGLLLVPTLLGMQRYVITGGSMEPTIAKGSLVFSEVVPTAQLRRGNVVTYRPPAGSGPDGMVTHRIVWSGRDKDGRLGFKTQGDANAAPDPWKLRLSAEQARVKFAVPYLGYVLAYAAHPLVRIVVIGLPALLIAFFALGGLWRDATAEPGQPTEQPA